MTETLKDFDRVKTVLSTNRVFGLVAESEIMEAKDQLAKETEPQIMQLLSKAEVELARLERRQTALEAKAQLQEVRLERFSSGAGTRSKASQEQQEKLKQLEETKSKLQSTLKKLNLQRQRARMSMVGGNIGR
jgi:DASH complex subunit SPC19